MCSTDNGPHINRWPDAAITPFRNEGNSNWEGAYRVPAMIRWPGEIKLGSVSNEIVSRLDWLSLLFAMAGEPDIKAKLLKGHKANGRDCKVHLDGFNLVPYLKGEREEGPRESFVYCNDDQKITGLRFDYWKVVFLEEHVQGSLQIWVEPFVNLREPKIFNLRLDPYERADVTSNIDYDWLLDRVFLLSPAQEYVGDFLNTFKEFPPRQEAASFSLDSILRALKEGAVRDDVEIGNTCLSICV